MVRQAADRSIVEVRPYLYVGLTKMMSAPVAQTGAIGNHRGPLQPESVNIPALEPTEQTPF